ncbi:hypothetical protein BH09BAC3_BH09BAC3_31170 [soil metagenome]
MRILIILCLIIPSMRVGAQDAPAIGIAQDISSDSIVYQAGYTYLVSSVAKYISPINVSDDQFKINAAAIKKLKTPLYAFNLFIPAELKLVGKEVNEKVILDYAEIVLTLCQAVGVKINVLGSGGARRIPDGFDRTKATEQFVAIARKIAVVASTHNIEIAVENLNSTETNFINTLQEAYEVVKKVNHPNLRLCADIYHMLKENESPAIIEKAGKLIVHCDLAEKENRTAPGVKGDDFRPYFKALKKINYTGAIIIESKWDNLSSQGGPALTYLEKQVGEVYSK